MNKQDYNPEEIDIIQFFNAVGAMFKNFFRAIKNLFKQIFYWFIELLLYIKKYYLYFGAVILLGLIAAFFSPSGKKDLYHAEVTVQTNYDAQIPLKEKIFLFNNLIKQKKYSALAKQLLIDTTSAKKLVQFDIKANINDVYLLQNYDDYLKGMDTTVYKSIRFKGYKREVIDNEDLYNYWTLKVIADDPLVFSKLNKSFAKILDNNQSLQNKKDTYMLALNLQKEKILYSFKEIDSMRKVYDKVMLEMAKNPSGGTSISLSDKQKGFESPYNLFYSREYLARLLESNARKINRFGHILQFKNVFPVIGDKKAGLTNNLYVKYPLIGIIGLFIILLLIDFNKYLNAYQKKKIKS